MPDDMRSRDAKCPFYRLAVKYQLRCEGYVDGIATVILRFQKYSDLKTHMSIFCNDRYDCCEIARLIMANKYDDQF